MNTTIIPEEELEAHDDDQNDILFYTLRELTQVSAGQPCCSPAPCPLQLAASQATGPPAPRLCPPSLSGCAPPLQGASSFFSLAAENRPALKLTQTLDYDKFPNMALELLARVSMGPPWVLDTGPLGLPPDLTWGPLQDTWEENQQPSHTATATLVLTVVPSDLRPPWFLPCSYSDGHVCIQAQYYGAVPTGHTLVTGVRGWGSGSVHS